MIEENPRNTVGAVQFANAAFFGLYKKLDDFTDPAGADDTCVTCVTSGGFIRKHSLDNGADLFLKLLTVERFDDVIRGAGLKRSNNVFASRFGSAHDDRGALVTGGGSDFFQ